MEMKINRDLFERLLDDVRRNREGFDMGSFWKLKTNQRELTIADVRKLYANKCMTTGCLLGRGLMLAPEYTRCDMTPIEPRTDTVGASLGYPLRVTRLTSIWTIAEEVFGLPVALANILFFSHKWPRRYQLKAWHTSEWEAAIDILERILEENSADFLYYYHDGIPDDEGGDACQCVIEGPLLITYNCPVHGEAGDEGEDEPEENNFNPDYDTVDTFN